MKKAFNLFFLVLLLLPVAVVLFSAIANPSFDMQTSLDFATEHFMFPPVVSLFESVFTTLEWTTAFPAALYLVRYTSYAFLVLLVKITYDFVTFLPILCTDFFERKMMKK